MEKVEIGDATLYLGDCREILPTLSPVDSVVTDPPYGLDFPYLSWEDTRENLAALIGGFLPAAREVSQRVVILPGITQVSLYPHPDWIGAITWNTTGSFGKYGFTQWMPVLLYGADVDGFGRTASGAMKGDVISVSGGGGVGFMRSEGEKEHHPCPKPENLMRLIVNRYSTGDVLDPMMGVGTTGVACANLGRKFVGIEIERRYFDTACERIEAAYSQGRLFA